MLWWLKLAGSIGWWLDGKLTLGGDHFVIYTDVELYCCTPETYSMLYRNFYLNKKIKCFSKLVAEKNPMDYLMERVGNGIAVHDFKCVYVLFLVCFTKLEYCHKYKLLIMSFILNILSLLAPNCSKLLEFKFQLACLRSNLSFLLLFMIVFQDYLGRRVKFSSF